MSLAPHDSAPPSKTELETVTRWPALLAAAGAGVLLLGVPLLLALAAVLRSLSREAVAYLAAPTQVPAGPVIVQPLEELQPAPPPPPSPSEPPAPEARIVPLPSEVEAPPQEPEPVAAAPARERPDQARDLLRGGRTEEEYLQELQAFVPEVDLETRKGTANLILAAAKRKDVSAEGPVPPTHPLLILLPKRPDLVGLPVRGVADCQRDARAAARMGKISATVRRFQTERESADDQDEPGRPKKTSCDRLDIVAPQWVSEDDIPTLVQIFQADEVKVRLGLVRLLARSQARAATEALAGRALFDLSPEVREAAVRALASRPAGSYRPLLLKGLRHPWSPAADHAAWALATLEDRATAPALLDLLDRPDPRAPEPAGKGKWVIAELVRVNHLRNCLLCHAPARSTTDPVRGLVPPPGKPLPAAYYDSDDGIFVRADVTYLRQDFSATHRVPNAKPWPARQRFDYLVRRRELTANEIASHAAAVAARPAVPPDYPQRQAVLFALRELTGLKAGNSSLDWRRALGRGKDLPAQ
jgi:hypothetical protein